MQDYFSQFLLVKEVPGCTEVSYSLLAYQAKLYEDD